jgi:hypothetical protein
VTSTDDVIEPKRIDGVTEVEAHGSMYAIIACALRFSTCD